MKGERITVGTTPTVIMGSDGTGRGIAGSGSVSLPTAGLIRNLAGGATVYLGHSGVTTSTGCPLAAGEDLELDLVNEILYGVVAAATETLYVLRRGD